MDNIPLQGFDFSVLDDSEYKEDSVREDIVAPLLRALGYSSSGYARMVRSRTLEHPYVQYGVKKKPITIIPDYLLLVNEQPRWVLDAKAPTEPVDELEHVAQAYSYAIHHEVKAAWYAICNGHELIVFNVADIAPRLRIGLRDLKERWQEVVNLLFPPAMAHAPDHPFAKDFGIHLMRLGIPETTDLVFPGSPVRKIARIAEDLYTGFGINPHSEGNEYAVSYDFDSSLFERLLSLLPPAQAKEIADHLRGEPPVSVWFPGASLDSFPMVTIWARLTAKILENDREMYLPLQVTRLDPFPVLRP